MRASLVAGLELERRRRRRGGRGWLWAVAVTIPLVLLSLVLVGGLTGAAVAAVGYAYFAQDLPDPRQALDGLVFTQQTVVVDRTGTVMLATLGVNRREPITFEDIPRELVDATTAVEDKTFWENPGFDPVAFVSAAIDTLNGRDRGASTITQQLVRERLLPASAFAGSVYERKAKEIIQSIRLTEAYPGVAGKQAIMEAYLNNNFYGNRSYGVAAAARSYWNKDLEDLTLAQMALLAAIPRWPARYDLVANAVEEAYRDQAGRERTRLVVPEVSEIVQRRNYVLDLMRSRSVLTGSQHSAADYEAAKAEPVILGLQASDEWRASQFVWQVRDELGQILCGTPAAQCEKIETGGYRVVTTLDYGMQQTVEKWVYAAAIIPNSANMDALLRARAIPRSEWSWIRGLRGHNIHNAAAAVLDYRTGEVLAYAGSASYTGTASRRFQPKFDVLSDGWRQSGSAIKPIDYAIGIDDRTMTAATLFMDVVTNFASSGSRAYLPTQADHLERGPVRLRSALQFSLNVPAIKAGFINGLDHQLQRSKDFGLVYPPGTIAVPSESIGTLTLHPIDLLGAYGTIGNGGVLMPRHHILGVYGPDGTQVWPQPGVSLAGKQVISAQAAYIITDILAGNTDPRVNPFWGKWRITNGVTSSTVRPAAYKTGTTSDNRDVLAMGYLAAPSNPKLPALVAGVWMGNSDNSPNDGKLSLDTSAPLWSAILSDASKGLPIEGFARLKPKGLVSAKVDAITGSKPGPGTAHTVTELFLPRTGPAASVRTTVVRDVDAASGLLWQPGCAGPMETRTFIDLSQVDSFNKVWQGADIAWQSRAARGPGVAGSAGTRTSYFYGSGFYPFGRTWGGRFAPTKTCTVVPVTPPPSQCVSTDPAAPCPSPSPGATPRPGG